MDKESLIDVLDAILGPALLGALSDSEIIEEYGQLGLSIVQRARNLLFLAKQQAE